MTTTTAAPDRRIYYGYWLIAASFIAQFIATGMQNYVIGPFMTPMTEALEWTRTEYTIPRTIGQFMMGVVGLVIGGYVDRYGGRPFMLAGAAILAIALYLCGMVTSLWQWIVINGLILTVGAAMIGNLVVNVTLAKWFVELRGRAIAWAAMGVSFAGITLTPATTWMIDEYGWRTAWQLLAVIELAFVVPVALMMRRAPEDYGLHPDGKSNEQVAAGHAERAAQDFANSITRAEALRTLAFYALILAFALFTANISVMLLQTIPMVTDAGFSRSMGAMMILVASVPAMLLKPVWGYFIDKAKHPKRLSAAGAAFTGVSLLVIIFSIQIRSEVGVYLGYFLLGCGWGGMIPLNEVIWASYFGRRYLGAVRGAALPFTLVLSAAAPLLVSYYYDVVGNYDGAIYTIAVFSLVSAVMMLMIKPPIRQQE
ncbi:MAG: MFS transporter [Pseudomonadota bacterium]